MDIKTYISSGVIEAYAIGNLSQEEASILECVMKNNAEVRNAVLEAQQTIEKLATEQAVEPPSHLKAEIFAKLDFNKSEIITNEKEAKIIPLPNNNPITITKNIVPNWLKVASVAAIFGLGYLGFQLNSKNQQLETFAKNNTELSGKIASLETANSVMKNAKKIMLKGVEKHPDMLAEVYIDSSNKVYFDKNNLPKAPSGKQYQLWAIVDGKPVDLGMLDKQNDTMQPMKSVEKPQAFAITLEKEGGNPTPTMEEMYVMGTI